ncbi:uncharacterized protein LOC142317560 [Lycorma delicatula]|uniref:uncharacterized protein LOC142317560 n=1 Tax=Lycorma delicatula TaxID=130591 RepID=UPI003F510737
MDEATFKQECRFVFKTGKGDVSLYHGVFELGAVSYRSSCRRVESELRILARQAFSNAASNVVALAKGPNTARMKLWLVLLSSCWLPESIAAPSLTPPKEVIINVITRKWTHLLNEKFLSYTLQPHIALEFQEYGPATMNMFKGMSPAMLRIGGPEINHMTFITPGNNSDYTVSDEQWKTLNAFAQYTNLDLIICVNPMERVHGVWQSRGALEFIDASDKLGHDLEWQLGYELQRLRNLSESLTGSELGRDVVRFRKILDSYPRYSKSFIIGPDVVSASNPDDVQFVKEYLNESGDALSVMTWHPEFSDEARENEDVYHLLSQIQRQLDNVIWARDPLKPPSMKQISKKEVWISESNPYENSGNFSDALTLAKRLGTAAVLGFPVFMKQITQNSVRQSTPDFWVSVLYKSLVGRAVLETKLVMGDKNSSHTFAHCTEMSANNIIDGDYEYERGAVTIFGVNLANEDIKLNIRASYKDEPVHMYILTAENKKNDEKIYLNGQLLTLSSEGELPILSPKVKNASRNIMIDIPARSVYFLVLPDMKVRQCTLYPTSRVNDSNAEQKNLLQGLFGNTLDINKNKNDSPDGEKEVYVRFGSKKRNKISDSEENEDNNGTAESLSKTKSPEPESEKSEDKELDRSPKSLKDLENKEKEKDLSDVMSNTKFILFSDDDWMSNFSQAKKAVEAAKKIIEAFDEAEVMKKKQSASKQQSVLQVENDKYHIQYGNEALRQKKFAVLTASVLGKQDNKNHSNNSDPISSDAVIIVNDHHRSTNDKLDAVATKTSVSTADKKRQKRHAINESSLLNTGIFQDLITEEAMLLEALKEIKRELGSNEKNNKIKSNHSQSYAETAEHDDAKPNNHHLMLNLKRPGKLNFHEVIDTHSNEKIFPHQNIHLKGLSSSNESNEDCTVDNRTNKNNWFEKDVSKEEESYESNESIEEKMDNFELYHPVEFYEHRKLSKVHINDKLTGLEDLSEAELANQKDNEETNCQEDQTSLAVVTESYNDERQDKKIKELVEKQLKNYFDKLTSNNKNNIKEEMNDYDNDDNESGSDGLSDESFEKNERINSGRSIKLDRLREKRKTNSEVKHQEGIVHNRNNSKVKQSEKYSVLNAEKKDHSLGKNHEVHSDFKKTSIIGNRMSTEGKKQIQKLGFVNNKHMKKREIDRMMEKNTNTSNPDDILNKMNNRTYFYFEDKNTKNDENISENKEVENTKEAEKIKPSVSEQFVKEFHSKNIMKELKLHEKILNDSDVLKNSDFSQQIKNLSKPENKTFSEKRGLNFSTVENNKDEDKKIVLENESTMEEKERLTRGYNNNHFQLNEKSEENKQNSSETDAKVLYLVKDENKKNFNIHNNELLQALNNGSSKLIAKSKQENDSSFNTEVENKDYKFQFDIQEKKAVSDSATEENKIVHLENDNSVKEKERLNKEGDRVYVPKENKQNSNDTNAKLLGVGEDENEKNLKIHNVLQNKNEDKKVVLENESPIEEKERLTRGYDMHFQSNEKLGEDKQTSNDSNTKVLDSVTEVNKRINLLINKKEIKDESMEQTLSINLPMQKSYRLHPNLNEEHSKTMKDENVAEEIAKHGLDIICGRTKNFGTFCIGSEHKTGNIKNTLENSAEMIKSVNSPLSKHNLNNNEHQAQIQDELESLEKSVHKKSGMIQRRETENIGLTKFHEYLDEGSPTCKASRSAPYIEDFEELLAQMQNLEKHSDIGRHRRLIHFTVPAINIQKINEEAMLTNVQTKENDSREISTESIENIKSKNYDDDLPKHQWKYYSKSQESTFSENKKSIHKNDGSDMKIHIDVKSKNMDLKKPKQLKRTISLERSDRMNILKHKTQSEENNNQGTFSEETSEVVRPEKTIDFHGNKKFNNNGDTMNDYSYFNNYKETSEDYSEEKKETETQDIDDYVYDVDEHEAQKQRIKSQQFKMHKHQPNTGYRERYYDNDQGSHRSDKYHQEHISIPGDVYGKIERHHHGWKQNNVPHYVKSSPYQVMPVMMVSPEMYIPKYSSNPSYHRHRRSLAPYFRNVQSDIATMKNEMIHLPSFRKERVFQPRYPKIRMQYPLRSRSSLLNTDSTVNMVVKDVRFKKRSTREIKKDTRNKTKTDLNEEKYIPNEILKDTKEVDKWQDPDSFDITLIKDKNKFFQSLTNKLTGLANVYLKESAKDEDDNGEPMASVKEKVGITEVSKNGSKIIIFNSVNDLKNSAEEDENKGSECTDKYKNLEIPEKPNSDNKIAKANSDIIIKPSKTIEEKETTFTYVVSQMRNIINYIVHNLIPLQ